MARITFISAMAASPWGGSEELWSQTAERLRRRGHTVSACVRWWPAPAKPLRLLEDAGCRVSYWGPRGPVARLVQRVRPQQAQLGRAPSDLVVISQGANFEGAGWAEACAERGLPYVLIAHAASEQWWPDDAASERVGRAYQAALASFFVSQGNLTMTRHQFGVPLEKARVVRNPFHVSYEAAPPWPGEDEGLRLACVGRLEAKHKGQDVLLQVLSEEKWRRRPLHVRFFGSGPNCESLHRMQRQYRLENVHFAGFQPDVEAIWREHHALILPSRCEGLPLTVVEAMLCARPCIVTDVAGNAELLEDNLSGFVADAPTPRCLDAAMERAWQRRAEWSAMGRAAAERVRQHIPADPASVFADRLLELLT